MPATKRTTEAELVRVLKALKSLPDDSGDRRTRLLRDLAAATVDLREHFNTKEGNPDWKGASGAYRLAIRDLYSSAGFKPDEALFVQNSLRYHVGNRLREVLSPQQLAAIGLKVEAPRERFVERRERASALLSMLDAMSDDDTEGSEADKVAVLGNVAALLTKLKPNKRALKSADNLDTANAGHQALRVIISRAQVILEAYPAKQP